MCSRFSLTSALATALYLLSGCASMSSQEAMPNMYQRAKVLSQDDAAISIEHNESGKQIASRTAARHCASVKRTAVFRDSITRLGSDVTSTWQCE